ncbi:gamma-glutamylcyclotransferase [Paraburkholderia sp. J10-1]|uniref:gamma-glutamylcyclotransferase n=1 Tax=Paraburkholderia sp. J10-1 TaxID=2805430 RepID=UPI002AB68AE1|nr:gamma-glutamylcyclotransferase [Paraburkholderia sp. J10-1]
MLTKDAIDSGSYFQHFESIAGLWTLEQIDASLQHTLRAKPSHVERVWIFAYGSLMWNPMIEFEARRVATLAGWQRSFCLDMTIGRATSAKPGRMLALRRDGTTHGLAFQLQTATLDEDLRRVWIREMVLGSYRPIWAPVQLANGAATPAIVFVADESSTQFRADSTVNTVAPLIGSASGKFGTNAEYLFRLEATLATWQLTDAYVESILAAMPDEVPGTTESPSERQVCLNEK